MQVLQLSAYYMIFHAQICQTIRKNIFKNIPGIWGAQGQKYSRYSPRGGYQIPLAKNIPKHSKKNIPKKIFQHLRGIPGIFKIGADHAWRSDCASCSSAAGFAPLPCRTMRPPLPLPPWLETRRALGCFPFA